MEQIFKELKSAVEGTAIVIDIRKSNFDYFTKEEYQILKNIVLENDGEEKIPLRSVHNETYCGEFELNGIRLQIWVEVKKTREEKIEELQKQIDALTIAKYEGAKQ